MKTRKVPADLRRTVMQVARYTDGWDLVVGKVMDRVSNLESRVNDLESQLMDLRCAHKRDADDGDDDLL